MFEILLLFKVKLFQIIVAELFFIAIHSKEYKMKINSNNNKKKAEKNQYKSKLHKLPEDSLWREAMEVYDRAEKRIKVQV